MWLYVQDVDRAPNEDVVATTAVWSACYQPMFASGEMAETLFYPHMGVFRCNAHGISSTLEVTVSPDDDVELRCISLTNHTDEVRRLRIVSYAEVVLEPHAADVRHPAFNKLDLEERQW